MHGKKLMSIFLILLCCTLLCGCGILSRRSNFSFSGLFSAVRDSVVEYMDSVEVVDPVESEDAEDSWDFFGDQEPVNDGYLSGQWSDKAFKRNGCSTYPFVLDSPLQQCRGFTVDYDVMDIDGRMKEDSKFQIFYRTSDGTWVKGKKFSLNDWSATVEQTISKPVTVTAVAVLCLNAGNFSWTVSMGVRSPLS